MTGLERLKAALSTDGPAEIPCWPQAYLYPVNFCDGDMRRYCTDADSFVQAQLSAQRYFGYDGVGAGPDITMEAESLGAAAAIPADAEPYLKKPPRVQFESDVETLCEPDPNRDGRLALVVEMTRRLAAAVKGDVPIYCQLRSPFVLAANLIGTEEALLAVLDAPAFVKKAVAFAIGFCERYGLALLAAGADVLEIGNAIAGQLSPGLYRELAAEPLRRVVERFHEGGAIVALHMCGRTSHVMEQMIASGVDIIEVDYPEDIPSLDNRFGRPVAWLGNIHPVDVLLRGPADRVRAASTALLERMGRRGRFILSAGCEPSIRTPREHLQAMVEAVRTFSRKETTVRDIHRVTG